LLIWCYIALLLKTLYQKFFLICQDKG